MASTSDFHRARLRRLPSFDPNHFGERFTEAALAHVPPPALALVFVWSLSDVVDPGDDGVAVAGIGGGAGGVEALVACGYG